MTASDSNNILLKGNAIKGLTLATRGSNLETSNLYSERNLDSNKKTVLVTNKTDYQ